LNDITEGYKGRAICFDSPFRALRSPFQNERFIGHVEEGTPTYRIAQPLPRRREKHLASCIIFLPSISS